MKIRYIEETKNWQASHSGFTWKNITEQEAADRIGVPLNELSKATLGSYASKAHKQGDLVSGIIAGKEATGDHGVDGHNNILKRIHKNRTTGTQRAISKLTKEDVITEEDDQHIVAKLRKIAEKSEVKPLRFNDGHASTIPSDVAAEAVKQYENKKTPEDRSAFAASLHHSLGSFKQAVGLKNVEDQPEEVQESRMLPSEWGKRGFHAVGSHDHKEGEHIDFYDRSGEKKYGKVLKKTNTHIHVQHPDTKRSYKMQLVKEDAETVLDEAQRGRRSAYQHSDIDFHKLKDSEDSHNTPTWEVHHNGKHIGHMTQHDETEHHMSTGRYRHSIGTSTKKIYRYHPTTERPTGFIGQSRRSYDIYNNKDDLSRHAARHGQSLKEDTMTDINEKKYRDEDEVGELKDRKKRDKEATKTRKFRDNEKRKFEDYGFEDEIICELSRKTLASYVDGAVRDKSQETHHIGFVNGIAFSGGTSETDRAERNASNKKQLKRSKGIHTALKKLAKEEFELDLNEAQIIGLIGLMEDVLNIDSIDEKKKYRDEEEIHDNLKNKQVKKAYARMASDRRAEKYKIEAVLSDAAEAIVGPTALNRGIDRILGQRRDLVAEAQRADFESRLRKSPK